MNKKEYLLEFRKKEANKNVIKWVDECIKRLEQRIERARIEEEWRGF